jgi:hypothetical protein
MIGCSQKEQTEQIPEIVQGYGSVKWGDSIEAIRAVYSIGEDVQEQLDKDDPNLITLQQDNVSDVIEVRRFRFIENKLYEVEVQYPRKVSSDDLLDTLREKYGLPNDTSLDGIGIRDNSFFADLGYRWDEYYPNLTVMLYIYDAHRYRHKVIYRWGDFRFNHDLAKLNRVEL